jgi:predicted O-methyltransferase YrrM
MRFFDRGSQWLRDFQRPNDKDLDAARQRLAADQTAAFIDAHMSSVPARRGEDAHAVKLALLDEAVSLAPSEGMALEFGVATGETLSVIARHRSAHGFDSFEGLPDDWYGTYQKGTFAQEVPVVENAEMHVGWFDDTLPGFLETHPGPLAFVHLDADLYQSTKTVFTLAESRFRAGTVIVFDEYFNYPGWQNHEHKAFEEFIATSGFRFEYLFYNAMHEQVAVRLLADDAADSQ